MKKAIVGLVAVGAVIGLRPVARRIGHEMHEHCEQMMAGQFGGRGEAVGRGCRQEALVNVVL
jgi:hypothetical protein